MVGKSIKTKTTLEDLKVLKESPRDAEVTVAGEIIEVLDVHIEPSQIDLSSAWTILIDGAKNSLGAGAIVVLESPERQSSSTPQVEFSYNK